MLHAVQSTLLTLSYLILTIMLMGQVYSYSNLKLEKTTKTKIDIIWPKSHTWKEAKSGFKPKFIQLQSPIPGIEYS